MTRVVPAPTKRMLREAADIGGVFPRVWLIGDGTLLKNHFIAIVQHGLLARNMFQAMSAAKTQRSSHTVAPTLPGYRLCTSPPASWMLPETPHCTWQLG